MVLVDDDVVVAFGRCVVAVELPIPPVAVGRWAVVELLLPVLVPGRCAVVVELPKPPEVAGRCVVELLVPVAAPGRCAVAVEGVMPVDVVGRCVTPPVVEEPPGLKSVVLFPVAELVGLREGCVLAVAVVAVAVA